MEIWSFYVILSSCATTLVTIIWEFIGFVHFGIWIFSGERYREK